MDTPLGFSAASRTEVVTRSGDVDPGVVSFFARSERMTASEFDHMMNHEAGLLGISETSSDMHSPMMRMSPPAIGQPKAIAAAPPLFQPTPNVVQQPARLEMIENSM